MKQTERVAFILITVLILVGCASSGVPDKAQEQIKDYFSSSFETPQDFEFEVTGEGELSASEQDQGIEQAICLYVSFTDTDSRLLGSIVIIRAGSTWSVLEGQESWKQHSCPGTYRLSSSAISP